MLGVDTNVLVRFFTEDEPTQFALARKLVENATEGQLFVNPIVLVELNRVLRRLYHMPRAEVAMVLNGLMDFKEFTIGDRDLAVRAIAAAEATGVDFSDALIALLHEKSGCTQTVTFDVRAQRLTQMIAVEEVVA